MKHQERNADDAMGHLIENIMPKLECPVDLHVDRDYVSMVLLTDNANEDERGKGRHTFEVPRELWDKHNA